jgi:hypothetical protein
MKWQGKCIQGHVTKYDNVRAYTWNFFLNNNPKQKQKLHNVM